MTNDADEQDLVRALDSVAGAAASVGGVPATDASSPAGGAVASPFEPAAGAGAAPSVPPYLSTDPARESTTSVLPTPSPSPVPAPDDTSVSAPAPADSGPLASIKQDALKDLRPLVDKLNVSAEEKFDTLLLLIRSTDDTELIGPAYEAAKAIPDETRRAEALLDTIKEIDYLSHQKDQ